MKLRYVKGLIALLMVGQLVTLAPLRTVYAEDETIAVEQNPADVDKDIIDEDVDIDEDADSEDIVDSFTITVVDKYLNEAGEEEKSKTRCESTLSSGEEYSFSALENVEGYELVGDANFSGTVTEALTLTFSYKKITNVDVDEPEEIETSYFLKVIDQYLDEEGNEEKSDVRYEETLSDGEEYSFSALEDVEGYELVGDAELSGVLNADTTLVFSYEKVLDIEEVNADIVAYAASDEFKVNVYASKDAWLNKEAPCVVLTADDAIDKEDAGGSTYYKFAEPKITVPENKVLMGWGILNGGGRHQSEDPALFWQSIYFSSDTEVVPYFSEKKDSYTVRFIVDDTIYSTATVADGESVTLPATPTKADEVFYCWNIFYDTERFDLYGFLEGLDSALILNPNSFKVFGDVDFAATFMPKDRVVGEIGTVAIPEAVREYMSENSLDYKEWHLSDVLDTLISVDGKTYCKFDLRSHGLPESCAGYTLTGFTFNSENGKMQTLYQYDAGTNTFAKEYSDSISLADLNDNLYTPLFSARRIHPSYQKGQCLIVVNDSYYESDGTTLIKTDNRLTETMAGGTAFSYDALNVNGYEYIGYSFNTSSAITKESTVSRTLMDDLTITFKYKKIAGKPDPTPKPDTKPDSKPDPTPKPDTKPTTESDPDTKSEVTPVQEVSIQQVITESAVEEPKTGDGNTSGMVAMFGVFDSALVAAYLFLRKKLPF